MKARLLDDLAAIAAVLAVAESRSGRMDNQALATNLALAREQLVAATRSTARRSRRPDGVLHAWWAAIQVAVMGVLAFVCAYAAGVLLERPAWLTVLVVILGQAALSVAYWLLLRQLAARKRAIPIDGPGEPSTEADLDHDVGALITRARELAGRLAMQRLRTRAGPIRTGAAAQWVGDHDRLMIHLHHMDAFLCGARRAWSSNPGAAT